MPDSSLSLGIVIGAAAAGSFKSVMGSSVAQVDRLGATIKKTQEQSRRIQSFRRLQGGLIEAEDAARKAKDRVALLGREMRRTETPTKKMRAAMARAHQEVHRANKRVDEQRQALNKQRLAIKRVGLATTKLDAQEKRLGTTVEKLRRRYDQLGASMARSKALRDKRAELGSKLPAVAAVGLAVALPIKGAIDFESTMADVKKVVNFETPAQFRAMSQDILKLSGEIPMAAAGIGEIVAAAGQAGIARRELTRFASDAAKMGVAFDMAGAEAGSAMTGLRSIFKLNQDQAVGLGDAYNHLSNNMDATARDMLNIANRTGSTATMFGLSGQQVGALGAAFLALKSPPEVAATGMNSLLLRLKTADKQGKKFQDGLAGIGLSAAGMKRSIERDAQGALLGFLEAVKSSDDTVGTLADLFGAEYADDMAKLVGGLDMYKKALGLVADETGFAGSMQKEYEARSKTTANSLQLLRNQIGRLGVTVGSVMLPPLNDAVGVVGSLVGRVSTLAERFPRVTKLAVGLTFGTAALTAVVFAGSYALNLAAAGVENYRRAKMRLGSALEWTKGRLVAFNKTVFVTGARTKALTAGGAIKSFGASLVAFATKGVVAAVAGFKALIVSAWAWTAALLANPITWVVVAVVGAAVLIYKYWGPISAFFVKLWDGIKVGAGTAWEWIKGIWSSAAEWFSGLSLAEMGKALIATLGQGIRAGVGKVWEALKSVLGKVRDLLPFSDAKSGPLSRLTASGGSILGTLGEGVRRMGPATLKRPLARALGSATAGLALTLPVAAQATPAARSASAAYQTAPAVAGGAQHIDNSVHIQQLTIHQQPGENARELADRIIREIADRRRQNDREALHDDL